MSPRPSIRAVLDAMNSAIFLIGADRQIEFTNMAARARFSQVSEGQDFIRAIRQPDCVEAVDAVLDGGERRQVAVTLSAAPPVSFDVSISPLPDDSGSVIRALVCFEDISQIRDAQQMRSEFVANVSHELRSPLTTLAGFIETIKGPAKGDMEAQARFLDLMEHEAQRMTRLIDDLLSLSKLQEKERVRPTGMIDIGRIIEQVIAMLASEIKKEGRSVRFEEKDRKIQIPGDEDELTQVVQNLIENAIKYGAPDTEIGISLDELDQAAGLAGAAIAINVRDCGPGIEAEHIPRLTERFYRVDKSRSRNKGGTGLGLAIVKHILNRHRGRLEIRSKVNKGSTFTVLLPTGLEKNF